MRSMKIIGQNIYRSNHHPPLPATSPPIAHRSQTNSPIHRPATPTPPRGASLAILSSAHPPSPISLGRSISHAACPSQMHDGHTFGAADAHFSTIPGAVRPVALCATEVSAPQVVGHASVLVAREAPDRRGCPDVTVAFSSCRGTLLGMSGSGRPRRRVW